MLRYFFEFNANTKRGIALHRVLGEPSRVEQDSLLVEITEENYRFYISREGFNPELYVLQEDGSIIELPFPQNVASTYG